MFKFIGKFLIHNNYKFYGIKVYKNETILWKCSQRKCSVAITTDKDKTKILRISNQHQHMPLNDAELEKIEIMTNIKERGVEDMNALPKHIIQQAIGCGKHVSKGEIRNMRLSLYRKRRSVCGKLPQPFDEAIKNTYPQLGNGIVNSEESSQWMYNPRLGNGIVNSPPPQPYTTTEQPQPQESTATHPFSRKETYNRSFTVGPTENYFAVPNRMSVYPQLENKIVNSEEYSQWMFNPRLGNGIVNSPSPQPYTAAEESQESTVIHPFSREDTDNASFTVGPKKNYFALPNRMSIYPQLGNQILNSGTSSSEPSLTAEQPSEPTAVHVSSRADSDNGSFTFETNRMESPASTQTSKEHVPKEHREISSKINELPQNISYIPKQEETIPVVDDEMENFVKSYGKAISKGLEALPAEIAIEFSLRILEELNDKILKAKSEQNSKDENVNGYDWCSVSGENEINEQNYSDSEAEMGGCQGVMSAEKPIGVIAVQESTRKESNIATCTAGTVGMEAPISTQTSREHNTNDHQKIFSNLNKPIENPPFTSKDKERVSVVDVKMKNLVESYGLAISRGLETLPDDVTIGVALNLLKELNRKVLDTKFKSRRINENKSIDAWRSVSDETDEPDDSDTKMDDGDQVEVLPKDGNGNNDLFLDIPIKIE